LVDPENIEPVGYWVFGECSLFVVIHLLAFPASGRRGGALADGYTSDSRIRHSVGSAVAFPKHLADSRGSQRYRRRDVEGNKGGGEQDFNDR